MKFCAGALSIALVSCTYAPGPFSPLSYGSVGLPHRGVLTEARRLPNEGVGFKRLRTDETAYGTPTMIEALTDACAAVASRSGPCVIADLSARNGGALLPKHASHRTGRDADVLFFVTDLHGTSVPSPGFIRFERHGLAKDDAGNWYRFDTERNWAFVKALVSRPNTRVEWAFVHPVIRGWLLDWAEAHGESADIRSRAEMVLGLAGGPKAAHDDHIHVRVSCTQDEVAAGCINTAALRDWIDTRPDRLPSIPSDQELAAELVREGDF